MRSQHYPLSLEEYHRLPKKLGWKYEYWDGQIHISPNHRIATVSARVAPRSANAIFPIRVVSESDTSELLSAYLAAFGDSVDYCDWEPEKVQDSARFAINTYFAGKRGEPHPASRVAFAPNSGELIGAMLLVHGSTNSVFTDMLFVVPYWQRRGVGIALLAAVMNDLCDAGVVMLGSRYLLANEASMYWHRQQGFVEEPDLFLAQYYYRWHLQELERRELVGDLGMAEKEEFQKRIAVYRALMDALGEDDL